MTETVFARTPPRAENHRLMKFATYASVGAALLLIVVKTGAWVVTDSVALLSTLVDSMLDAGASLINLLAVRHALQPADREHRFGHGKAEPLAGLAQSAFVAGSGVLLLVEAVNRLYQPAKVESGGVGIAVMVFSIMVTMLLVRFQKYVVSRTESVAINADSLHYTGDVLINGSVILSLLIAMYLDWPYADPLFALGIAAFLLLNAFGIAREAMGLLMDREFPEEDRTRIKEICAAEPDVLSMHDLRTRSAGPVSFIQLHLELDGSMSLAHAHAISDKVEAKIRAAFPNAEVIIHQDPAGIAEPRQVF